MRYDPLTGGAILSSEDVEIMLRALDRAGRYSELVTGRCRDCTGGWARLCNRHAGVVADVMDFSDLDSTLRGYRGAATR